jgi:hypothetical protein
MTAKLGIPEQIRINDPLVCLLLSCSSFHPDHPDSDNVCRMSAMPELEMDSRLRGNDSKNWAFQKRYASMIHWFAFFYPAHPFILTIPIQTMCAG